MRARRASAFFASAVFLAEPFGGLARCGSPFGGPVRRLARRSETEAGVKRRRMFLQRRKPEVADLYEEPFSSFGLDAVDKLFSESELEELISLVRRLAA